jgi:hypothetical protein
MFGNTAVEGRGGSQGVGKGLCAPRPVGAAAFSPRWLGLTPAFFAFLARCSWSARSERVGGVAVILQRSSWLCAPSSSNWNLGT